MVRPLPPPLLLDGTAIKKQIAVSLNIHEIAGQKYFNCQNRDLTVETRSCNHCGRFCSIFDDSAFRNYKT